MKTKTINNKEFAVFDNMEDMSDFAMEQWSDVCRRAIEARGIFTVALSGGSTPITLYQKLAARDDLPWDKTHFFIVDERFVPYDSTASNFRMINRALLLHISVPAKNIHPILTVGVSAASAAEKYERDIAAFFKLPEKTLPSFDLILLGMGEDGHTASLFPDTASVTETARIATHVWPPDEAMHERISLTFPVINNAVNILLMASGSNKAATIQSVVMDKKCKLPAARIRPEHGRFILLLDQSAAAALNEK